MGTSALADEDVSTPENLVDTADKALYAAKSSGRNRTLISN
ncbi:hypothetical protein [Pseudomonas sp. Dout3]|nr:hypothetical protein [Pseudomonas sp. Dout3]MEB0045191.1 hypothetical protein [Pseudomonas sp. Dout3]MEB0096453.1 hypothetical protein [Pseudomonas sp. DC1.2]